jgi:hypothetical protein
MVVAGSCIQSIGASPIMYSVPSGLLQWLDYLSGDNIGLHLTLTWFQASGIPFFDKAAPECIPHMISTDYCSGSS